MRAWDTKGTPCGVVHGGVGLALRFGFVTFCFAAKQ